MTKRKIIALALTLSMVAILAIGGTLAYFSDTDSATNVFTTGKVDIELQEKFDKDNAKLQPGKQNAVTKEVAIYNELDSEDAYVWYTFKIPTVLDSTDGSTGTNNIIHVNAYGRTWDAYKDNSSYWEEGQTAALPLEQTWDHDPNVELPSLVGPEGYIGHETIDGIEYNVYLVLYHGKLTAGKKTTIGMSQVYMDQGVDYKDGNYIDKNGNVIEYDFSKNIKIIVNGYGIQATGFADVYEAYTAYVTQEN